MAPPILRKGPIAWLVAVAVIAFILTPPLMFVIATRWYQLVETRWQDSLVVIGIAFAVIVLVGRGRYEFTKEAAKVLPPIPRYNFWSGAAATLWCGAGIAGLLLFVNGALDRGKATQDFGILSHKGCARGCSWVIQGLGVLKKAVTLDVPYGDNDRANVGDSVRIEIKPGLLGRAWVLSSAAYHNR